MRKVKGFFRQIREAIRYFRALRFMRRYKTCFIMPNVVNFDTPDLYLGTMDILQMIRKHKIDLPSLEATPGTNVASIGYSYKNKKWYGWSNRAICGFEIGNYVSKGDITNTCGFSKSYLKEHPKDDFSLKVGFTAKTTNDCKRMAIAFAKGVS